jgi:hypothetical protein
LFFQNETHLHRANPEKYNGKKPDGYQELPLCRFDSLKKLLEVNLTENPYQQAGGD